MTDTIFALSSGAPPAGIAIIRISGPKAAEALLRLAGGLPAPRRARLSLIRDPDTAEPIDRALALWFPGPGTATGEDLAEIHGHGGRAVVKAIEAALTSLNGLRRAEPGEFTRRAFLNGRMDLNEVEGLSDLLAAETQQQRRAALLMTEGHFSRQIEAWQARLLQISAWVEAALDFSDEDDVPDADLEDRIREDLNILAADLLGTSHARSAERLRDGVRVVLAGPPNAGKSTLLNALVGREAAIVSDVAGTTRDRIEVPVAIRGTAFLMTDTAGLRCDSSDRIEAIGMDRARAALDAADIVLWLGEEMELPRPDAILIAAQADRQTGRPGLPVSALTGAGMDALVRLLLERAAVLLPSEGDYALHERQRRAVTAMLDHVRAAAEADDLLICAEELRQACGVADRLTGRAGTEDMLDRLFSGFCIGK